MSRFSQKFLLPIMMILSVTLHLSPFSIQAMESPKQYDEHHGATLSPLLRVFLKFDLNDQFKSILGQLDDGDVNSLLIATAKHDAFYPLHQIIKEILGKKCMGWFVHDLDSDELSPFSYAPYIARSFYFRLIGLIKAQNDPIVSTNNTRQSLQNFLKSIPSLQNHSASYLLEYMDNGKDEHTLSDRAIQGDQGAFEVFLLLYTYAKQTPLIPQFNSDPHSEIRIVGIMSHVNLIYNLALKQVVLSNLDADQASLLGERFTFRGNDDHLSYLDQYQSLYDARQCFLHAQTLTPDKIRFATLNQYIGDTYAKEAQLRDKQGSLEIALETYKQALFYFFQPDPKIDQEEIKDQDMPLLEDDKYSNRRAIYQCLKKEAHLHLKMHQYTKALNNFKLARNMFAIWADDKDPPVMTSDKLTALQSGGICYAKEGTIHQLMKNTKKALSSYQKARNLFQYVLMERPDFNATILEYHFANCYKSEGTIYYKQGRLLDAISSYKQAEIYFTDALSIRVIYPHWKAQYGLASCLIKQVNLHRLLGRNNDTEDLRTTKKALLLLSPILKLINHPQLRKKAARLFNTYILDLKERDIDIKEVLRDEEE